jgi:hypothetical protein
MYSSYFDLGDSSAYPAPVLESRRLVLEMARLVCEPGCLVYYKRSFSEVGVVGDFNNI